MQAGLGLLVQISRGEANLLTCFRVPLNGKRASSGPTRVPAIYVGDLGRTGALSVSVEFGEVKFRGFKRLAGGKRFPASVLEDAEGLSRVSNCSRPAECVRKAWTAAAKTVGLHIWTFPAGGGIAVCEAWVQVFIEGRTDTPHSNACKQRMMGVLGGSDEGRARIEARENRKSEIYAGKDVNANMTRPESRAPRMQRVCGFNQSWDDLPESHEQ